MQNAFLLKTQKIHATTFTWNGGGNKYPSERQVSQYMPTRKGRRVYPSPIKIPQPKKHDPEL